MSEQVEIFRVMENGEAGVIPSAEPLMIDNLNMALTLIEEHELRPPVIKVDLNRFCGKIEERLYGGWMPLEVAESFLNTVTPNDMLVELIEQYKNDLSNHKDHGGPALHIVYAKRKGIDIEDMDYKGNGD